ncbi:MAG: phytase [Cyanophyceae cyanobacterium]
MVTVDSTRFSQFNVSLFRNEAGELNEDLSTPDNEQIQNVAEIIQRTNPDVLLVNEFDYDPNGTAAALFQENYLSVSQNGVDPVEYPYVYLAPSNTGIPSNFDLDNNGEVVTTPGEPGYGNDAFGFGNFPGQFAMVLYSKFPIVEDEVRTFQTFLWQDMPNSLLPEDFYSEAEQEVFRLSSKSHWDVPIDINGEVVHVLASHPTPPVFDGDEDRNGRRNHDEIRFWADYVTPGAGDYIYDDAGNTGGLAAGERFVIMGDQNADPFDGDDTDDASLQLLDNPQINITTTPASAGGPDAAERQNAINDEHLGNPALDTADFSEPSPGNLRADYVLPSQNLEITDAEVFWLPDEDPLFAELLDVDPENLFNGFRSSDHRLVYVDVLATDGVADRQTVTDIELIGEVTFETGFQFANTEVGGLSGMTYDPSNQVYYALSDDRSMNNDARFYTLDIDVSDGSLDEGDVSFNEVTTLLNEDGEPFPVGGVDPEGIAYSSIGSLYISSEGDASALLAPFVNEFSLNTGELINELPVPDKFLPTTDSGIQNNRAFESLTITPDNRTLYTATEGSLLQDGAEEGPVRILRYDLTTDEPGKEFAYFLDEDVAGNGLVELLALDNTGTLLSLERGFSPEIGNTLRLFEVQLQNTTDISDFDSILSEEGEPFDIDAVAEKTLLLDFNELGIELDNSEALAFGPTLPDGRQSLFVVSDNNFNDAQFTQFLAFALDLETIPAVAPSVETPSLLRYDPENPEEEVFDSDDPAIYVHPDNPAQSFVITALKNGGFGVYDLEGQELQLETPEEIRYNNVDLIYDFELAGETVDLAVFSDRANDTLAIYSIDPDTRQITNVTGDVPETIFGVDDGEQTAYGLATYTSPVSGAEYAFVSQSDGNQVAQLELVADGDTVAAEVVRSFAVPVPEGEDIEDGQVEGMVVDRELGYLYVGQEGFGIYKYYAEPDAGNDGLLIDVAGGDNLVADIEGLTIYYGADGNGYLLASSQGDSTFALYERAGFNQYFDSFAVGDANGIDGAEESDGADVTNVPLGEEFPDGLFVTQDGANEPAAVLQDPEDGEIQNFNTNFKYVDFADIAKTSELVEVDTASFDPRTPIPMSLVNGVASGDTTQDSTVLWARSTFPGEVTFEYSTEADFSFIAGTATATVDNPDVPVKVNLDNLEPDTQYFYRVTDAAGATANGEFETAAELGSQTGFRFGATGDWQQAPPYPSLKNADERDLELFVKLGDTIFADAETPALPGVTQARTLNEFRTKQAEVLSTRFELNTVPELYASTSILSSIDDHELVDNFAGGAAPGESPDAPDIGSSTEPLFTDDVEFVNDTQAYEAALQAFQEYHPLRDEFYGDTGEERTANERQLYRYNNYGSDAAVIVLDSRSFRDDQLEPADLSNPAPFLAQTFDPSRTLLGEAQLELVKADLLQAEESGVTWKFVVIPEPIQNFGPLGSEDRFEGYAAERTELLKFIDDNEIDNVVFMAGDFHGTLVNNLTYQLGPGQEQIATDAFEIVTGPAAFFDGLFGPTLVNIAAGAGLLSPEEVAFYESLPVAGDADSVVDDRDDFVKQLINDGLPPFGYDPLGLDDNLGIADSLIDATLLEGDYVSTHTFGWTEFDIAPDTQKLTVTTYGIDPYSEAELLANPEEITSREPRIVSQFEVNPSETPTGETIVGDESDESLSGSGSDDLIAGGFGNDEIDGGDGDDVLRGDRNSRSPGGTMGGDDTLIGSAGDDRLGGKGGNDDLFGGAGVDTLYGDDGDDLLRGGAGDDILQGDDFSGGEGSDTFVLAAGEGTDTIVDFEVGIDFIGLADGLSFAQLAISPDGSNSAIALGNDTLAIVNGVDGSTLTEAAFVVV